jgi:hypothetical protein
VLDDVSPALRTITGFPRGSVLAIHYKTTATGLRDGPVLLRLVSGDGLSLHATHITQIDPAGAVPTAGAAPTAAP